MSEPVWNRGIHSKIPLVEVHCIKNLDSTIVPGSYGHRNLRMVELTRADRGFPIEGGGHPPVGYKLTILSNFPKKNCMQLRKFWSIWWAGAGGALLASATDLVLRSDQTTLGEIKSRSDGQLTSWEG